LPIVDTWWQTETGGIYERGCPRNQVKGFAPCHSWRVPEIVDADARCCQAKHRNLCMQVLAMMRTVYGDPRPFEQTYFSDSGQVFTGDGCRPCEAITGSPARRRRHQRSGTAWAREVESSCGAWKV